MEDHAQGAVPINTKTRWGKRLAKRATIGMVGVNAPPGWFLIRAAVTVPRRHLIINVVRASTVLGRRTVRFALRVGIL